MSPTTAAILAGATSPPVAARASRSATTAKPAQQRRSGRHDAARWGGAVDARFMYSSTQVDPPVVGTTGALDGDRAGGTSCARGGATCPSSQTGIARAGAVGRAAGE